jgi:type I restriction enzyme S subunit
VTSGTIDWENVKYIDDKQHGEMQRRVSPRLNDILLAKNGTTGVAAMVDRDVPFDIYVSLALLRPLAAVRPTFLLHFINSPLAKQQFTKRLKGIGVPNLHLEEIREVEIPVPPLAEQQRIVGLLDEAFEGLATAKANAEKILQNARALFESHLQSVFTQRGPGWVETTLEEVVDEDCTLSYGIVQPGNDYPGGLPVVRPTDLTVKAITLDGLKRIDPKLADGYRRTTLRGKELLLCVRGSTGVISITTPELAGANVTRGIVPIVFEPSRIRQDFGYFLMTSEAVQSQIRAKTYGAALMQINIGDLRKISVSFPPLKQQGKMASELDALSAETQRLTSLYERKLAALEALKKALLHQAFAGEL